MRDLAPVRALPRPLAALAVCLFGLGGCGLFGGNAPSGNAVSQGPAALTDMPTIAMIAPPDPFGITPVGPEAILDPLAPMDDRITALEGAMASLTGNIDLRLPAIDRMIGIEADIRVLLTQLAQLADTSPPPAAAAAAPIEAPGPAQALPGLAAIGPPEVGAGQELPGLAAVEPPTPAAAPSPAEIGPPMAIVPVEPVAEAPLAPMPAPAPPQGPQRRRRQWPSWHLHQRRCPWCKRPPPRWLLRQHLRQREVFNAACISPIIASDQAWRMAGRCCGRSTAIC